MEQLKLRVRNGICICFTAQGKETATRLLEKLSQQMEEAFDFLDYTGSEHSKPLKQVVKEAFQEKEAILFVGAAGIAVRLIAPWVQDKLKDPAVRSRFCLDMWADAMNWQRQRRRFWGQNR